MLRFFALTVRQYFPVLVYNKDCTLSIPLNAFILSQSALNVKLSTSIPFETTALNTSMTYTLTTEGKYNNAAVNLAR